jgi:hypothetical protein
MARYSQSDYSDAPTMIMSPANGAHLPHNAIQSRPHSGNPAGQHSFFTKACCDNPMSWSPLNATTPTSTNLSRKRSRDETDLALNHDGSYFPLQKVSTPAPIPEEPIYGEGMVLLNPSTGMSISAESQTGTWYEEKVEIEANSLPSHGGRPEMPPSRKSVRLDPDAPPTPRPDDIAAAVAPESPPKSSSSSTQPTIDDFTYTLGIGWTRIASEDPDIQAAARGWARYLENHYPVHVHGAEILLKSKGLNAYLVGCQEGFYLFNEDLLEGRLVGRSWDSCLNNLRTHPILFEGEAVLRAERTPGPDSGFTKHVSGSSMAENTTNANDDDDGINGRMDVD